jgi:hypothetical protein
MGILNNIRYGVELERAQMDDNGLNESPSLMNSLLGSISGATQEGTDRKRTAMTSAADKRQYGDLYTSTTGKAWRDGMSGATALNEIKDYKESKITEKEDKLRGYATSDRDAGYAQQSLMGRQQIEASNNQFLAQQKSQDARYAHTDKQNRLDRGLERELASNSQEMNLAIAQMNSDLADKRMDYDRETRRMDKRSAAIAQLMSGIGALGGAFAL